MHTYSPELLGHSLSHSILPVTALGFVPNSNLVLAGRGSWLTTFGSTKKGHRLDERKVFARDAIHGIRLYDISGNRSAALIWGGRFVCAAIVYRESINDSEASEIAGGLNRDENVLSIGPSIGCSDWILDCAFDPANPCETNTTLLAVAVTAHNALIELTIDLKENTSDPSKPTIRQRDLSGATRCMLYSAHIRWRDHNRIVIAAGTAFGTVIIWSYPGVASHSFPANRVQTHHVFMAHPDGSVFGVHLFSQHVSDRLYIATCSDDRTIKVWSVPTAPDVTSCEENTETLGQPRLELGEGVDDVHGTPQCLAFAIPGTWKQRIGHLSRIWHISALEFARSTTPQPCSTVLVTLGEDATCQLWEVVRKPAAMSEHPDNYRLRHIRSLVHHAGKNAWSFDYHVDANGACTIATGGADGRVAIQRLELYIGAETPTNSVDKFRLSPGISPLKPFPDPKRSLKSYAFASGTSLVSVSMTGEVLQVDLAARKQALRQPGERPPQRLHEIDWNQIGSRVDLRNYSVMTSVPDLNLVFVAGSSGFVYAFDGSNLLPCPSGSIHGEKVGGLFAQHLPASHGDVILLVTSLRSAKASLCILSTEVDAQTSLPEWATVEKSKRGLVHLGTDFVVTSMLHASSGGMDMLFLGSREGRIAQYALSDSTFSQTTATPFAHMSQGHQDSVTCMLWEPSAKLGGGHLLTTSRDGSYSIHEYTLSVDALSSKLVHKIILPFGPYIEGVYLDADSALCFYGFHSEDFVIYTEGTQQEISRIACGGSHRVWAFSPPSSIVGKGQSEAMFAWTRATTFNIESIPTTPYQCLQQGGHGREIKASAISPGSHLIENQPVALVATGAEDTDIRLFAYYETCDPPRCVGVLRKHDTGIQKVQWSSDGRYLFSCGGREEFFVWRIRQTPFVAVSVVCEAALPTETDLSDLRIMDFDVLNDENESHDDDGASFIVAIVFSNATMRTYRYTRILEHSGWSFLSSVAHGDHCLTTAHYLIPLRPDTTSKRVLVTGGTNGYCTFWSQSLLLSPGQIVNGSASTTFLQEARLHQNSIKDMVATQIESPDAELVCFLVLTVGDDNALGITLLRLHTHDMASKLRSTLLSSPEGFEVSSLLLPRAHAASATSVALISRRKSDAQGSRGEIFRIVTGGNDQRLKMWDVSVDCSRPGVQGVDVARVINLPSGVADVSSLSVFPESFQRSGDYARLLIVGVGMEVWRVPA